MHRTLALNAVTMAIVSLAACSSSNNTDAPASHVDSGIDGDAAKADVGKDTKADSTGCPAVTCASQGAECGDIPDGCGGLKNCGTCPSKGICGGGGPNRCGDKPCQPATCASKGANCGELSDGCSKILACGTCKLPDSCAGAGVANKCGCTPEGCGGATCGSFNDGCGGKVSCGSCTPPETCGGGGDPSRCGCTPDGCGATTCGDWNDGCGNTVSCGTCTAPETCGGGGIATQCGCSPTSCANKNLCDASSQNPETTHAEPNDCGGTLQCGVCCTSGNFCAGNSTVTQWRCGCGLPGAEWGAQGGDCYHLGTAQPC